MEKTRTTLDQWITLQAVVDYGGFAQAAEILHRTQSSISYTISKLEQTLEIEIFSLEKRRAVLTKQGEQLLALSREVTNKAISLEEVAKSLNCEGNNKINIVIDSLYQSDEILKKIGGLSRSRKDYDIDLKRVLLKKTDVFEVKNYDLLITHHYVESLNLIFLEQVEAVFVSNPNHKLQHCQADNVLKSMEKTTLIALGTTGVDSIKSIQTIHVPNVDLAIQLTENSIGYLWLPKNLVQKELNNNSLKELKTANKKSFCNFYMYLNKNSMANEILRYYLIDNEKAKLMSQLMNNQNQT
ncbi:LysR family transcriptional regulator [Providencia rettgeri]|uniref:LysR family transcriptional regulator n=1 Tax=Providencia rettgeri TaxID=587 RepID=UPI0022718250|nr:LysR family transcriptional regulator [Providencia rettgeri]MCX9115798.1 LysR family transcriptional regulator [Providencia rettgeri]